MLNPSWYPVKNPDSKQAMNPGDGTVLYVEAKYPGAGVAQYVVTCWQELQEFNASGGYSVEIPWHAEENRELTPAEVTSLMMRGKKK